MNPDIALAIASLLSSTTAITDLVGARISSDRLFAGGNAIVFWVISEVPHEALDGPMDLDQARVQFNAYADSRRDVANQIAWEIWQALAGYNGVEPTTSVFIKGVSRATGVRYSSDRVKAGTEQYRFIASQDLLFSYCSGAVVT